MTRDLQSELDSLLHDLNAFNRNSIKNLEDITKTIGIKNTGRKLSLSEKQAESVREKAQVLLDTAQQSELRIRFYEMLAYIDSPGKLDSYKEALGTKEIEIYGKFHKASLGKKSETKKKKLKININQEDYTKQSIKIFPLAELLPFVLLDNAIKYAPTESSIDITIADDNNFVLVKIENEGPTIHHDEINLILKPSFRGENAKEFLGHGMGLYFVDIVSQESNIDLKIECDSEKSYILNNLKYSTFIVKLKIPKRYI